MHIKAIAFAVFVFGLFASFSASAYFYSEDQLPYVEEVVVSVADDVRDGCLPQPTTLKTEAELILRRSGIKVLDEETPRSHKLLINPIGQLTSNGISCFGGQMIQIFRWEKLFNGTAGLVLSSNRTTTLVGPKSGFGQYLREDVNEAVSELANEILKARQNAE